MKLVLNDCKREMKWMKDDSIDSIVCDPPYELGFMGKKWDNSGIAYDVEVWQEALRVLKPGGHLLAFGGTRTHHRMMVAIEDAGFEIRDCLMWVYGTGFPKSHNISKAIDKAAGIKREIIGKKKGTYADIKRDEKTGQDGLHGGVAKNRPRVESYITAPATEESEQWAGWGTALKPAYEPIVLARKPLSEKTIANNVLTHGTGGINIDDCRIETEDLLSIGSNNRKNANINFGMKDNKEVQGQHKLGRFPANVILECICDEVIEGENLGVVINNKNSKSANDTIYKLGISKGEQVAPRAYKDIGNGHTNPDCPCKILDGQSGHSKSSSSVRKNRKRNDDNIYGSGKGIPQVDLISSHSDMGGASRFFYCAKASKQERNVGAEDNTHPTVKPIKLMEYLVKLITPPNGTVLDPFMGSGSTGCACVNLGFDFYGIELEESSYDIAKARIDHHQKLTP